MRLFRQDQARKRFLVSCIRPKRPLEFIDVLIAEELSSGEFATRLFSTKRFYSGPDWNLLSKRKEKVWALDQEAEIAITAPAPHLEHAFVYVWRPRHGGIWRESMRDFLALAPSEADADNPPLLVKLVAYSPKGGERSIALARERLDQFVTDFRKELKAL